MPHWPMRVGSLMGASPETSTCPGPRLPTRDRRHEGRTVSTWPACCCVTRSRWSGRSLSVLEQQLGELVQAAPPCLPLVRGPFGHVHHGVDAGGLQLLVARLQVLGPFLRPAALEDQPHLLVELP